MTLESKVSLSLAGSVLALATAGVVAYKIAAASGGGDSPICVTGGSVTGQVDKIVPNNYWKPVVGSPNEYSAGPVNNNDYLTTSGLSGSSGSPGVLQGTGGWKIVIVTRGNGQNGQGVEHIKFCSAADCKGSLDSQKMVYLVADNNSQWQLGAANRQLYFYDNSPDCTHNRRNSCNDIVKVRITTYANHPQETTYDCTDSTSCSIDVGDY